MKILADENISQTVIESLRKQGHDVISIYDLGMLGIDDERVMDIAIKENRIIITLDLDFGYLYFKKREKVRIIVIRARPSVPTNVIRLLNNFLKLKTTPKGLIIITENKIRTFE